MEALSGIRILDLSRVLAGPLCTQILGDLGADIIKIERPHHGDDTRNWGPPFLKDENGHDTTESAYYLSVNRNKRSVTIDFSHPQGQDLIHQLLNNSDILIENFVTGHLKTYGLDYETLIKRYPKLIYCSISGYGHSGPMALEPGYDLIAQAVSGLMSVTGHDGDGPLKVGAALGDVITGLQAAIGILAALNSRQHSGKGQHIDLSLVDCTLASMVNLAQHFLTSNTLAPRLGNAHSTIVPYQTFQTSDGYMVLAIGNDLQFSRFCDVIHKPEWKLDKRFSKNQSRIRNRAALIASISKIMLTKDTKFWIEAIKQAQIPCGPVNNIKQAFSEEQTQVRGMQIEMKHILSHDPIKLVGNPLKMSETPVSYNHAPPICGQHSNEVLENILKLDKSTINDLKLKGVI